MLGRHSRNLHNFTHFGTYPASPCIQMSPLRPASMAQYPLTNLVFEWRKRANVVYFSKFEDVRRRNTIENAHSAPQTFTLDVMLWRRTRTHWIFENLTWGKSLGVGQQPANFPRKIPTIFATAPENREKKPATLRRKLLAQKVATTVFRWEGAGWKFL